MISRYMMNCKTLENCPSKIANVNSCHHENQVKKRADLSSVEIWKQKKNEETASADGVV
jgi:hypothetical protein